MQQCVIINLADAYSNPWISFVAVHELSITNEMLCAGAKDMQVYKAKLMRCNVMKLKSLNPHQIRYHEPELVIVK